MPAPFPIDPHRTAIAIAYQNKRLIADAVLPRVPVSKESFTYMKHKLGEDFTVPDTKVGRKSRPNEISFSATEQTASTVDFGLDDPIPYADIENAPENYDPLDRSTESLTNLILLDREVRAANLVFNDANYTHKSTLSGNGQWSDYANSDPLTAIMEGLDSVIMRPNIGVFGRATFTKLSMHPIIVKAIHGNSGDSGVVTREQLAQLLELEDVLVGEGFVNTAKKGQATNLARVWGKHASFIYRDEMADTRTGTTFGFTAQFGERVSGGKEDGDIGLRGGIRNRVGESVKELVTAPDLGLYFKNAVA